MNTAEFLRLIWPEDGPYLIGTPVQWVDEKGKTKKALRHFAFDSVEGAAQRAMAIAWDRDAPKDCYFALGSLVENRRKRPRVAENIHRLRAFWLDLDVDADPRKYVTQKEAVAALKEFVKKAQLPVPHVVSSGYGIHAYWPLDQSVHKAEWLEQAERLKYLTKALQLKVDHSRTSDCASVLRPVGTANWKGEEPREVKLLLRGEVVSFDKLCTHIDFAIRTHGEDAPAAPGLPAAGVIPTKAVAVGADINHEAGTTNVAPPSDPRRVVKRCLQLARQLTHPNEVTEPSWYSMVGCIRHCTEGHKAVHFMSRGYSGYSEADTNDKIAHHVEVGAGPTLCETFEEHNPGGCEGCPHKGKIRSPISLGYRLEQAEGPKGEIDRAGALAEVDLPDPPYPFQRIKNPNTGEVQIAIEIPSVDGEPVQEIIYERDLYPSGISYDERESKFKATMRRLLPKDGWGEFTFPLGDLFDRRSLAKLLGNIGVLPDSGRMDTLVQYMIGYLKQLQNQAAATVVYAQLGWRDDAGGGPAFVLPDRVVSAVGEKAVTPSSNIENALAWDQNPPKGDLDVWRNAVAGYNAEGMEALQFLFGVGFAAPLFQFTPYSGMVISAVGPSGCGKSTAALCANSIWGHPHMGWADVKNDTIRAFYNKLGVLRHLPVTYDEITNLEPDMVSDLCYAVSKGRGRQRLEQDGSAKANHGDWQTMMITTSNASLHSKLSGAKADASAEAVRVFEFYVPPQTMTKQEADAQFLPMLDNYGLAGPIYAKAMVEHTLWVRNRVKHWSKQLDKEAGVVSSERFWSAGAACVLAGFDLANRVGLTSVDTDRVFEFAVSTIRRMRTVVQDNTRTPVSVLADYLNGNLRNTLVVSSMPEGSRHAMVTHAPSGELRVRYELWNGRLYIDRAHFRRFCVEQNLDVYQLRRALHQDRILVGDQARIVLGRNTTFSSAQTNVWTIDMNHPAMSGVVQAVTSDSAPEQEDVG